MILKVSGVKEGITISFTIPQGPCAPFSDTEHYEFISPKEAFSLIGQLRHALFDWSKANGGSRIDDGGPS
jgi:hypothetical protein